MIYSSKDMESRAVLDTAAKICAAARTAPKTRGMDGLVTCVLTGEDKSQLAAQMRKLADELDYAFFTRDADNVEAADAVVLFGMEEVRRGLDAGCQYCHFESCADCTEKDGLCAWDAIDIGIAIGSAAAAAADASHPVKQGLIQAMGVYFDTLFVCTASAMLVLLSPEWMMGSKLTGIALVQKSVAGQLGEWTNFFMTVIVLFFAFSSIIGNYFYGEMNMPFISKSKYAMPIFRVFVVVMVFVGSIASLSLVWDMADLFMALMAIVNLVAIFMLGKYAIAALRDYNAQKRRGILDPVFDPRILPDKKGVQCWPRDEDRRRKAN